MEGEEETQEITMEDLYEGLKAAMILACFEKEFGPAPNPLRYFKFRRWVRDFEAFQKGVWCGEMMMRKMMMQSVRKSERRSIEEMEEDE